MRVIGIDPGTRVAGYGVVELTDRGIQGVAAGVWRLGSESELAVRLGALAIEFRRVLAAYSPQHLCLELAFVSRNPRSALFLGHARGVILSEAHQAGLVIHEISATAAKKSVTSHGRADKESVARSMSQLLRVRLDDLPFDATDALCIAYARALSLRAVLQDSTGLPTERSRFFESWKKSEHQRRRAKSSFQGFFKDSG